MKITIIGGGYAGCCLAKSLRTKGHKPIIIESSKSLGGMAKSYTLGGMTYEFGPHILANHNSSEEEIKFILEHVDVVDTQIDSATLIDGKYLNYPPYIDEIKQLPQYHQIEQELAEIKNIPINNENFETYLCSKIGKTLYDIFFKDFTRKFWLVDPKSLSADWAKIRHLGENLTQKKMFFNNKWCTYPKNDFNELFKNLTKDIEVKLDQEALNIDTKKCTVTTKAGLTLKSDLIISTISIDQLFNNCFGALEYRGYDIKPEIHQVDYYHPQNTATGTYYGMVYYPSLDVSHSRITEYKAFNKKQDEAFYKHRTIVTIETPSKKARFYPFMDQVNESRFSKYLNLASKTPKAISIGRLGLYKYTTIDTTTSAVFRLVKIFDNWLQLNPTKRLNAYLNIRGGWNN